MQYSIFQGLNVSFLLNISDISNFEFILYTYFCFCIAFFIFWKYFEYHFMVLIDEHKCILFRNYDCEKWIFEKFLLHILGYVSINWKRENFNVVHSYNEATWVEDTKWILNTKAIFLNHISWSMHQSIKIPFHGGTLLHKHI